MTTYNIDWKSGGAQGIPGKQTIVLPQKTKNSTSTSLTLTGRGVENYGEIQQENFIQLMEHFASATPPDSPTVGQIWYNSTENILYMHASTAKVANTQAVYLRNTTTQTSWVQIWPSSNPFASLSEYSAIASVVNSILSAPSSAQYGWNQTELAPEYTDINTLKSGFSPAVYPPQFDNTAWVILLARLKNALTRTGLSTSDVSPVGFINDGRPTVATNGYTSGWGGAGIVTLQLYYNATLNAVSALASFVALPPAQPTT